MIFFFTFIFLFTIIAPFLYFLYLFHHHSLKYKIILGCLSFLSLVIMIIKISIHPYSSFFFNLTLLAQFYILTLLIMSIISILTQLICRFFHFQYHKKLLIIIGVLSLTLTSFGFYSHFHKVCKNYNIVVDKESSLSQLKIAMISDMHIGTGTYLQDVQSLVKTLNHNHYDIVCFVGDLFDESTPTPLIEDSLKELSHIQSQYGLYAVNGNHEHYAQFVDSKTYKKYNIHHLSENYVCVNGLFNIVGREDVSAHLQSSFSTTMKDMNRDLPTLVLDHNPKRYQDMTHVADLQLSGHTHGGQYFPLTLVTAQLYDDVYGLLQKDNFSLVVSSGYGSWGFPFRLTTQCEYVEVLLTFRKK